MDLAALRRRCVVDERGCWLFLGKLSHGYGQVWVKGRHKLAHRISLEIKPGRAIQEGKWSLHECDVRQCCNPDHLYEGTPSQNSIDIYLRHQSRYKLRPEGRAALVAEIEAGGNVPETCRKYGVNRNWWADHRRLIRLGRRK